ncbi:MAG: DUF1704 domain-containing protein [Candidatus Peribacteraceae bacterium]|nr:DUF1704 domain-containing protein [Candidatus Peribacteraceae bacterium]
MNARNLLYIKPYNPRSAIALADDKIKAKAFLSARGIPTARVFGHIRTHEQLLNFDFSQLPDQCVLKPNFGFGGEGIKVFKGRKDGNFIEGKKVVSEIELREHIEKILEGEFSVNGKEDTAFFEQLLVAHEGFAPFRPAGLPDIRFVVFNLVPVMAMLRIPTPQSGGKANVHLGGVGVGIDLATGKTTSAVQYNRIVDKLPNGIDPRGIQVPYWQEMMLIASRIQQVTDIGYLAVDLTIDDKTGPELLEVNARAGLMVQIANLAPLRARLERVKGVKVTSPEKGVLLAQELFGQKKAASKTVVQKGVLGLYETIHIPLEDGDLELTAQMSPQYERTAFTPALVQELLRRNVIEVEDEKKKTYRARLIIGGRKIQTIIGERAITDPQVRASIGRRDLTGFLLDPSRKESAPKERMALRMDMNMVDRQLSQLEREMPILKWIKPENFLEHRQRAEHDPHYEPHFTYAPLTFDAIDMRTRIASLRTDDSPLGNLLGKKRDELLHRISLLDARGDNAKFTSASIALYGKLTPDLVAQAHARIDARRACLLPLSDDLLQSDEEVKNMFELVLEQYGLSDWTVTIRDNLLSDCAVGKGHVYIRSGARFEPSHIGALIAHEIETHALCAENGANQEYEILQSGTANYLTTQEGLAVFRQNKMLPEFHDKLYWSMRGVLAIEKALALGLHDLRQALQDIGYSKGKALTKALSLKRGCGETSKPGCFTKDLVYFRGLQMIEKYVEEGKDLKRLYIGRVSVEELDLIEKLPDLKPPILLPRKM